MKNGTLDIHYSKENDLVMTMVRNKMIKHNWLNTLKLTNDDTQYFDTSMIHREFFDELFTTFNVKNLVINKFEFHFWKILECNI